MTPPERWRILEDLFDQAAELPAGEARDRFLDERAGHDADLRLELHQMLSLHTGDEQHIGRIIDNIKGAVAANQPWLGKRIGPYRILREIGRGGMGVVFEAARDDHTFEKRVAIKIAPEWLRTGPAAERFRAERQILAGLEHPGICRMLDGGATDDGTPYFVMELVEGEPLRQHCQRLGLRERLHLFVRICEAVQYAHERLVIHRDLKPANILVDAAGNPKLLDFGIATLTGREKQASGQRLFTPDYSSPEQLQNQPISTRTDVYALGLLLHEMLTGSRAQKADTTSPDTLERSICETTWPLPSVAKPGDPAPPYEAQVLRGDLDAIVAKATRKDPNERYASASELARDLQAHLELRPVLARPQTAAYRVRRYLRRNWLPVSAATIAMASIVAGAAGFAYQANIAEERFRAVRNLATTVLFDVHDRVEKLPGSVEVRAMIASTAAEHLAGLSAHAGSNWELRRELAAAYLRLGTVQSITGASLGLYDLSKQSFDRGLQQIEALPASERAKAALVEGRLAVGRARLASGFNDAIRGEALLDQQCHQSASKIICAEWTSSMTLLAQIHVRQSNLREGMRILDRLDAAIPLHLTGAPRQLNQVNSLHFRAGLLSLQDRFDECRALLRQADPLIEDLLAKEPNNTHYMRIASMISDDVCLSPRTAEELRLAIHRARRGLTASERLVQLDPADRRADYLAAQQRCALGLLLAGSNREEALRLLRAGITRLREHARDAPANLNHYALLIHAAIGYLQTLEDAGMEAEALTEARATLQVRAEGAPPEVIDLRARIWIAQLSTKPEQQARLWNQVTEAAKPLASEHAPEVTEALLQVQKWKSSTRRAPSP